jgi:BAH domain
LPKRCWLYCLLVAVEDGMENGDGSAGRNGDAVPPQSSDVRFHQLKCRELFLSRQVETLSATHIRGKCSVTLLSEAESPLVYLDKEVSDAGIQILGRIEVQ